MNNIERKSKGKLIFYICGISIPLVQFLFFYIFIVSDSILMAFQNLEDGTVRPIGFTVDHFVDVFKTLFGLMQFEGHDLPATFLNSVKLFVISLLLATPLNILFSNYLYKKKAGYKFFQVMLFVPQVLSSVVMARVFKFFVSDGAADITKLMNSIFGGNTVWVDPLGQLAGVNTQFIWLMIFRFWAMFGGSVLVYTSTMSGIPTEVVESAQLDGITPFKELIYITMPMIYPTFVTFMLVNVASLFTDQMHLYTFYGTTSGSLAPTLGYYIFKSADEWSSRLGNNYAYLSALGVTLSAIAIPLTFGAKKLLEKIGPSFE